MLPRAARAALPHCAVRASDALDHFSDPRAVKVTVPSRLIPYDHIVFVQLYTPCYSATSCQTPRAGSTRGDESVRAADCRWLAPAATPQTACPWPDSDAFKRLVWHSIESADRAGVYRPRVYRPRRCSASCEQRLRSGRRAAPFDSSSSSSGGGGGGGSSSGNSSSSSSSSSTRRRSSWGARADSRFHRHS